MRSKLLLTKSALSSFIIAVLSVMCAALLLAFSLPGARVVNASAVGLEGIGTWHISASGGFGAGKSNFMASPVVEYKGSLYTGVSNQNGAEVRVKQGNQWNVVSSSPGFGNVNNIAILSMHVYGNYLYVGTLNFAYGCEIWQYDGTNWTMLVGRGASVNSGFGSPTNMAALCMEVHDNKLYVGTLNVVLNISLWPSVTSNGAEVWAYNGSSWSKASGGGFGDIDNYGVTSLKEYNGSLYAGTMKVLITVTWVGGLPIVSPLNISLDSQGCELWRQGASSWEKIGDNGFTRDGNTAVMSMENYNGKLWLGTLNGSASVTMNVSSLDISTIQITDFSWSSGGMCIYSYDGSVINTSVQDGLVSTSEIAAFSMTTVNAEGKDLLLVGSGRAEAGDNASTAMASTVWAFDGENWYSAAPDGFGTGNMAVMSLVNFGGDVWAGTLNADAGCEIWYIQPAQPTQPLATTTFYFAEGYTGPNFQEYLCLGNPESTAAAADITYMYSDGTTKSEEVAIPADSRATVNVNTQAGSDRDVSLKIESNEKIVAERPMYFKYNNAWTGGHDAVGATRLSYLWYFAEGYTGPGFDEWICVLNPGDDQANLTFYFQTQESGQKVINGKSVAPHSRGSFKVNDLLGGETYQTSLMLTSDQPIVSERPMYFDYTGTGNWHWTGGHCVMGTTALAKEYYFAEGTTRNGFEEWLTLQNPNPDAITVNATYQVGPGQGGPIQKSYRVPASGRYTVLVPSSEEGAGPEKDVSVYLSSSANFLAERPIYFKYSYNGLTATGGHCVIGASSPGPEWFLAEGYTGSGFNEWLCIQNPDATDATVQITYYTQEKGALPVRTETIPARTRVTLMVNQHAGPDYQLSTRVKVVSGPDIVVERPMYFIYNGWDGGHDVLGYTP